MATTTKVETLWKDSDFPAPDTCLLTYGKETYVVIEQKGNIYYLLDKYGIVFATDKKQSEKPIPLPYYVKGDMENFLLDDVLPVVYPDMFL